MLRRTIVSCESGQSLQSFSRMAKLLPRRLVDTTASWRAPASATLIQSPHFGVSLLEQKRLRSTGPKSHPSASTLKSPSAPPSVSGPVADTPLEMSGKPQTIPTIDGTHFTQKRSAEELKGPSRSVEAYVYCAMNNSTFAANGKEMDFLTSVGFGLNEEGHVAVTNPAILQDLAARFREATSDAKQAALTKGWPRWFRSKAGSVLIKYCNTPEAVPVAMQEMLDRRLQMFKVRQASRNVQNVVGDASNQSVETGDARASNPSEDGALSFTLNREQEEALAVVERGFNTYIGGSAGTGKTVLIRAIVRKLKEKGLNVAVTATTGIAGCHIGGSTFHHALGATINNEFVRREELLAYNVVIIDEISMMSQRLFEEFDAAARAETGCVDLPFGGMQVVLCGDFLQLGAINERSILHSKLFRDNFVKFRLMTQVRQSEHLKFAQALSIMRKGVVPRELMEVVKTLPAGTLESSAVNLLPTNADVADANAKELARLEGDPITFTPLPQPPKIVKRTSTTLVLQSMPFIPFQKELLHDMVIKAVERTSVWPRNAVVSIHQQYADAYAVRIIYPDAAPDEWCAAANTALLDLAPTIHLSSVGARLFEVYESSDGRHPAEADDILDDMLKKHAVAQECTFKVGARVLLRSNLTSGLVNGTIGTVTGFAPCQPDSLPQSIRDTRVDDLVERYRQFCDYEGISQPLLPIVKFYSGEELAVPPMEFDVGGFASTAYYSGSRIAIPLTLAYAFTVHKVQGLTLVGRVHLELSKMWPCDHLLYVAMSRVKNPDQLSVSGFDPAMVRADALAVEFDDTLPDVFSPLAPEKAKPSMWKALDVETRTGKTMEEVLRTFGYEDDDVKMFSERRGKKRSHSILETKLDAALGNEELLTTSAAAKSAKESASAKKLMKIVRLAEKMQERRRASASAASAAVAASSPFGIKIPCIASSSLSK